MAQSYTILTYCLHAPSNSTFWVSMPSILTWRQSPGNYHIPPVEQIFPTTLKGGHVWSKRHLSNAQGQILVGNSGCPTTWWWIIPLLPAGFSPTPPPLPKKNNGFPTSTVPPRRRRRVPRRRPDFNQRRLGAWKSVSLGCWENDMVYIYI